MYGFLLVLNDDNYVPNLHCFHAMTTTRCTYSHLTLKITFKVKFKVTKRKALYDFLLMANSN